MHWQIDYNWYVVAGEVVCANELTREDVDDLLEGNGEGPFDSFDDAAESLPEDEEVKVRIPF